MCGADCFVYEAQVAKACVSWYAFLGKGVAFMNTYVTGATIKQLRENRNMTQAELAEKIGVSSKTAKIPMFFILSMICHYHGIVRSRIQ